MRFVWMGMVVLSMVTAISAYRIGNGQPTSMSISEIVSNAAYEIDRQKVYAGLSVKAKAKGYFVKYE